MPSNSVVRILWFLILVGIVYGVAVRFRDVTGPGSTNLMAALQDLPTLWTFYAFVLALICLWLYRHRQMHDDLHTEFEGMKGTNHGDLNERDWGVAEGFRKRALGLRLRADFILGSMFAVMFAGVYFVIFVSGQLGDIDREIAKQRLERNFKIDFAREFESLAAGRYWVRVGAEKVDWIRKWDSDDIATEVIFVTVFSSIDGKDDWSPRTVEFLPGERPSVLSFSADGGKNWSRPDFALAGREDVRVATLSADGRTALVAGRRGSVYMSTDGGKNWSRPDFALADREDVRVAT